MGKSVSLFASLLLLLWLTGCGPKQPATPALYSDITPFLQAAPAPLGTKEATRLYTDFLAHRYAPWQMEELNITCEEAAWTYDHYRNRKLIGENLRPIPAETLEKWIDNARFEAFNSLHIRAITTHPTSLRLLPTDKPIFYDPALPGEGFPFDTNQNSGLKAMTPLLVSHLSRDGGWAFVQSPFAIGWVRVRDIVALKEAMAEKIMETPLAVWLDENGPVKDTGNYFLFYAKLGTLFPVESRTDGEYRLAVVQNCSGIAHFRDAETDACRAEAMPLAMTRENIARVAERLLDEPYGWGGLYRDRDCSAMTRDFFAPFGIWLPRNSSAQANVGRKILLKGLESAEKERLIIEKGVPFRTLIHLPGHIMLYVGHRNGRAYVMHNLWGIRTEENGRYIIGKAVITDLHPGENLPGVDRDDLLVNRIDSMNIVVE
ncbi:SH3 domain-containing protein [Hydrogenimonas sp. SS33]|uniref:SH3 domain-containing protein n=1 Tax=Hydrogenimonas leucolamina TaxID=2954236 RepID=UPI00336BEDD8